MAHCRRFDSPVPSSEVSDATAIHAPWRSLSAVRRARSRCRRSPVHATLCGSQVALQHKRIASCLDVHRGSAVRHGRDTLGLVSVRSFHASLEAVEDRTLMSTLSAISWKSGGVQHSEVFAMGYNNSVSVSKDGGSFVAVHAMSRRSAPASTRAETRRSMASAATTPPGSMITGPAGSRWGGFVKAISASVDNTVFAIGGNNAVYMNRGGTNWVNLGGDFHGDQRRPRRERQPGGLRHQHHTTPCTPATMGGPGQPGRLRPGDQPAR